MCVCVCVCVSVLFWGVFEYNAALTRLLIVARVCSVIIANIYCIWSIAFFATVIRIFRYNAAIARLLLVVRVLWFIRLQIYVVRSSKALFTTMLTRI